MDANQLQELTSKSEQLAQLIARDNYGLSVSAHDADSETRIGKHSRLHGAERDAFEAGWDAAKAYYDIHS